MRSDRNIQEFLAEAEDILESASQTLLALEDAQGAGRSAPEQVNSLFRSIHSFKGLAGMFGLKQIIEVGPMCGLSNVIFWLDANGYPQEESLAKQLFQLAKSTNRVLTDDELHACVRRWRESQSSSAAH